MHLIYKDASIQPTNNTPNTISPTCSNFYQPTHVPTPAVSLTADSSIFITLYLQ